MAPAKKINFSAHGGQKVAIFGRDYLEPLNFNANLYSVDIFKQNIRIRIWFLFFNGIHSYSYSVFIFQPDIFTFVVGFLFLYRIYSCSYSVVNLWNPWNKWLFRRVLKRYDQPTYQPVWNYIVGNYTLPNCIVCVSDKVWFSKVYFAKCIFQKCIFAKCIF